MAIYRDRPPALQDSTQDAAPGRGGRYAERYVAPIVNNNMFAGDEGSYFQAISATPGTGVIGHAAPTTFDETKPYLLLYNGGTTRVYPQFLRFYETVVSTAAVRVQFTVVTDTGNRYSSAGTALTINNVNQDSALAATGILAYQGAVVATAASASRRILDHIVFRGTIDVVEDCYTIAFGAPDGMANGSSRAATVQDAGRVTGPICIGPNQSLLIHQWSASQSTGPTLQVTLGFIAR